MSPNLYARVDKRDMVVDGGSRIKALHSITEMIDGQQRFRTITDFLNDKCLKVKHSLGPVQKSAVWDGVIVKASMWAYAREHSAKEKMRECFNDDKKNNLEK